MFKTPYDTTAGAVYEMSAVRRALQHALVQNELQPAQTLDGATCEGLMAVPPYVKAVPPFGHPLLVDHFGDAKLVVDTRAYVRQSLTGESKVVNATEYRFLILRGLLTQAWLQNEQDELNTLSDLIPRVFARLMAEGIVRRLGLNPMDQMQLTALAAYFHLCQYRSGLEISGHDEIKIAQRIARVTLITVEKVLEMFARLKQDPNDPLRTVETITEFCAAAQRVSDNTRLQSLDPRLLYATIGGCWFGANAREVVAVALEYPPTFLAMVYMALTDRSYHKAFFTQLVEQCTKGSNGKDFVARLTAFLETGPYV